MANPEADDPSGIVEKALLIQSPTLLRSWFPVHTTEAELHKTHCFYTWEVD